MELHEKTREELLKLAGELNLKPAKSITDGDLKSLVEREAIRHTMQVEEEVRADLQMKSKIRLDVAEIKATAELKGVKIEIPEKPTLEDTIRLKKELDIKISEPKPSPETVAIEASRKIYARFHNQEEDDVDMACMPGGEYFFHFWPEKVHVIPEWLIGWMREFVVAPVYANKRDPNTGESQSVRTGSKARVLWEKIGDAPKNASFGVVLDEKILAKIEQPV